MKILEVSVYTKSDYKKIIAENVQDYYATKIVEALNETKNPASELKYVTRPD